MDWVDPALAKRSMQLMAEDNSYLYFADDTVSYRTRSGVIRDMELPTSAFGGPAGSIGLGFAIPAEQAERTATQLIETGRSEHPVMGVHIDLQHTGEGAQVMTEARRSRAMPTPARLPVQPPIPIWTRFVAGAFGMLVAWKNGEPCIRSS